MIDNVFDIAQIAMQILKTSNCVVKMDKDLIAIGVGDEFVKGLELPDTDNLTVVDDTLALPEIYPVSKMGMRFIVFAPIRNHGYIVLMDSNVRVLSLQETDCLNRLSSFVSNYLEAKDKLKQIAFLQSHVLRKHLANVLGLCDLLKEDGYNEDLLVYLFDEANNMDEALHDLEEKEDIDD